MSAERLERFFASGTIRSTGSAGAAGLVVFAPQNVLQDPPFSRLDIATCRNLLIYRTHGRGRAGRGGPQGLRVVLVRQRACDPAQLRGGAGLQIPETWDCPRCGFPAGVAGNPSRLRRRSSPTKRTWPT